MTSVEETAGMPLTKGSALVGLVKTARLHREAFEGMLPQETRDFLNRRILTASWYPEVHLRDLLQAGDRVFGKGDLAYCREAGRLAVRDHLGGVYASILARGDPMRTMEGIPGLWSLYHNTGTMTLERTGPHSIRFRLVNFGLPNAPLCECSLAYWAEAVKLAGGVAVKAEEIQCRARGGFECLFTLGWSME